MKITVVIPVYNEEKRMESCLKALCSNTRKPDQIIVADGGSTDRTVYIAKRFPNVTVIDNPKKTAAAGRNLGIKYAKGDVIAFTDGDCIPDRKWIESIEKAFEEYDIDGLGGKVKNAPFENDYERYWGTLAWTLIMNFPEEAYEVKEKNLNDAFVTANCAYKRSYLKKVRGFSNWFANNAEDIDICWRILDAGAKLMYIPDAVIYAHNVTTLDGIKKKSFRNGVSSSKLQKKYGTFFNYDLNIYKMWFRNFKGLLKGEKDADLNLTELTWHLLGKYYGSFLAKVINI